MLDKNKLNTKIVFTYDRRLQICFENLWISSKCFYYFEFFPINYNNINKPEEQILPLRSYLWQHLLLCIAALFTATLSLKIYAYINRWNWWRRWQIMLEQLNATICHLFWHWFVEMKQQGQCVNILDKLKSKIPTLHMYVGNSAWWSFWLLFMVSSIAKLQLFCSGVYVVLLPANCNWASLNNDLRFN